MPHGLEFGTWDSGNQGHERRRSQTLIVQCSWKRQDERCAPLRIVSDRDAAAVRFHDSFAYTQAESVADCLPGTRSMDRLKRLEQIRQIGVGNARPVIANANDNYGTIFFNGDLDRP